MTVPVRTYRQRHKLEPKQNEVKMSEQEQKAKSHAPFVINAEPLKVDFGNDQYLYVRPLGHISQAKIYGEHATALAASAAGTGGKNANAQLNLTVALTVEAAVDWKGFVDGKGKEVPFSRNTLQAFLMDTDIETLGHFLSAVVAVTTPAMEKQDTELKNSQATSPSSEEN